MPKECRILTLDDDDEDFASLDRLFHHRGHATLLPLHGVDRLKFLQPLNHKIPNMTFALYKMRRVDKDENQNNDN